MNTHMIADKNMTLPRAHYSVGLRSCNIMTSLSSQFIWHNIQWLKCNGTQGNAVPPPPIHGSKRPPTSDRYNARERHTTIVMVPNMNVALPHL